MCRKWGRAVCMYAGVRVHSHTVCLYDWVNKEGIIPKVVTQKAAHVPEIRQVKCLSNELY